MTSLLDEIENEFTRVAILKNRAAAAHNTSTYDVLSGRLDGLLWVIRRLEDRSVPLP